METKAVRRDPVLFREIKEPFAEPTTYDASAQMTREEFEANLKKASETSLHPSPDLFIPDVFMVEPKHRKLVVQALNTSCGAFEADTQPLETS